MSQITRAILVFNPLEMESERLREVNEVLENSGAESRFQDIGDYIEGRKYFGPLYAAVFNGFGSTKLRTALNEVAWQYPKEVQILIKEEEDPTFRSYPLENWIEPPEERLARVERELAELRYRHRRAQGFSI